MSLDELPKLKSSVPGQYLGYGLQPVRLCLHLLTEEIGCRASLEQLDDVAIHYPSGDLLLEQAKSATASNPAADRSVELWKTLSNWAILPKLVLEVTKSFRYYVTPLRSGGLVHQLHGARDTSEAKELLRRFKTGTFKGKVGSGIEPYVSKFLSAGDDVCLHIIKRFEFASEEDPLVGIRLRLLSAVPEDNVDGFCEAAIGMAKAEAERLIRDKKPAIIDAAAFRRKMRSFIRKYDFSALLVPTTNQPPDQQVAELLQRQPTFVRQLTAVHASRVLITTAVSDFMRTTADKVNWADAGVIVDTSLDELDESLVRHHGLTSDELIDTHGHVEPPVRGRHLYRRCTELQLPLEGRTVPNYFVAGEYNCLAEDRRLGWHPEHKTLFPAESS